MISTSARAAALALIGLILSASPANTSQPVHETGNFYGTATLDTSQVEAPAPFTKDDYVCFRSTEYPEWSCVPAQSADPRIFTDERIIDIQLVNLKD